MKGGGVGLGYAGRQPVDVVESPSAQAPRRHVDTFHADSAFTETPASLAALRDYLDWLQTEWLPSLSGDRSGGRTRSAVQPPSLRVLEGGRRDSPPAGSLRLVP